ncbi:MULTISPECIES: hypothetical protein [unclassified Aurantimonas]|uniref:hypothetical protein n=1 Tax=unclassified Aurantimonas TaxID=2638230 RepID=UPI002E18CEFC|nr:MULTISPECIES: hypothetical protein [unclassified Aurantimonas]MEC5291595.1 hypothetical protein [Aurantimonas sp. C2-3-R2]MEC5412679.1 hypothetical protein [Aurantimonas sp. C2-4-R8]
MPIYNNPALGQAFESIASQFAPPSGAEASGWANANAKNAEAKRLADFYALTQDPNADWNAIDRAGIGAGSFVPTQSMRSVEMGDATDRYGYDQSFAASTQNNVRDNQRAVQVNQLDNQRAGITALRGKLAPGEVQPALEDDLAAIIGLPPMSAVDGPMKPQTEEELKAAIFQGLPDSEKRAITIGSTPVRDIVTPEGPRTVFQADSPGTEPYFNKGAEAKPDNGQFAYADGRTGPAIQDRASGRWLNARDGTPLVGEYNITKMAAPTGTNEDVGIGKAANNQVEKALIDTAIARDTAVALRDLVARSPASQGAVGWLRGTAQNVVQTGGELGQFFGGQMAEVAKDIEIGAAESGLAASFDPSIPAIEMLSNLLAFQYAKTTTGERLSNEMLRSAKAALGLDSLTANQADALTRLNQAIQQIDNQAKILQGVRSRGIGSIGAEQGTPLLATGVAPSAAQGSVERWERGPDGQMRRAQ